MITHLRNTLTKTSNLPIKQTTTLRETRKDPLITAIFLLSKPMDYHYLVKNEEKNLWSLSLRMCIRLHSVKI